MRLFLSSYKWSNYPEKYFEMINKTTGRIAIIANSTDMYTDEETDKRLQPDINFLNETGFQAEKLDLRKYFDNNEGLQEKLETYDAVWVKGGNAFLLRRAYRQSGFDKLIMKMLEENMIVYGGFSAGACVMGSSLKGLEIVDDPSIIPDGYEKEIIWEGLGAVEGIIVPHYKSDHPESSLVDKTIELLEAQKLAYVTISDGDAIVIK